MATSSYKPSPKALFVLSVIFVLALSFRIAYLAQYRNTAAFPVLPESDADFYYQRAQEIASGDIFNSKAFLKWPFYAYLLAFLFKVSANSVPLVYALQFLLGASTCVLVYFIARRLFNEATGLIAALLYACYGLFIFYEGLLIYTSLSLFLNALLFLLVLRAQDNPGAKKLFCLGMLLGVATITQGNIIIFGVLAVLYILWQKGLGSAKYIRYFSCFCLGTGLVLGVLVLRSYVVDREAVLLTGNTGLNFYIGNSAEANGTLVWPKNLSPTAEAMLRDASAIARLNNPGKRLKPSGISAFWFKRAGDFIKNNPYAYLKLLSIKVKYLLSPREIIFEPEYYFVRGGVVFKIMLMGLQLILPFAFLGMFLNIRNWRKTLLLYLVVATLSFSIILFFVQAKFRIMLVPFFMVFAASGAFQFWEALRQKRFARFWPLSLMLIALFILLNQARINKTPFTNTQAGLDEFRYHFSRAIAYEKVPDYQAALSELNLADEVQPGNHNIAYSRGAIYYSMNKFDKAEEEFKRAIAISPFFVDAYYNLGFLYNRERRTNEAIALLEKAAFLDPDDIGVMFELSRAYRAKGMLGQAREELRLILEKTKYRPLERAVIEKELSELGE
ncbi:MAG: glycosyltransferase family 39 protein [Candidatus Omnitrophica bacterium]|nr:glycosyltransferase family 39 protein [Candidatus Omnitrophota bacterium]